MCDPWHFCASVFLYKEWETEGVNSPMASLPFCSPWHQLLPPSGLGHCLSVLLQILTHFSFSRRKPFWKSVYKPPLLRKPMITQP